jgi:hypothetical protein
MSDGRQTKLISEEERNKHDRTDKQAETKTHQGGIKEEECELTTTLDLPTKARPGQGSDESLDLIGSFGPCGRGRVVCVSF